jgi:hypothetical protein
MSKKHIAPLLIVTLVLSLAILSCGDSDTGIATTPSEVTEAETEVSADTPVPTATLESPTSTPEPPTNTPEPPEPAYNEPVTLLELDGIGEAVTDNYELPRCLKAIFYWTVSPNSYGSASLILKLHNIETGRDMTLVNEFEMDLPEDLDGASLQPLAGGEYFFSSDNTDEAWTVRLECQDGVAPATVGELEWQGEGNRVSPNYELPACRKSVFIWSVEPDDRGTAALIAHLCEAGKERCPSIVNKFEMDLSGPLEGETLESLSGGIYYLATSNVGSRQWNIKWECQD